VHYAYIEFPDDYFTLTSFEELVRLALKASKVLHVEMRAAVRAHTEDQVRAMGGSGITLVSGPDEISGNDDIDEAMPGT